MLPELALWLTAPASWRARRDGHVGRSVALWSRATRRRREWAAHLERSRAVVEAAIDGLPARRKALVLGSGLLQDVPMPALLAAFGEVILVDAAHLLPARLRHLGDGRVRFVERDLSGFRSDGEGRRSTPLADFAADPGIDFVLSANLLSQLPLAFSERRDAPSGLGARVVQGHLDDLAAFTGRVCLITDVAYDEFGPGDVAGGRTDMLEGVSLPAPDAAWSWDVSPRGEEDRLVAYRHVVHAYADWAAARQRPPGEAGGQSGS